MLAGVANMDSITLPGIDELSGEGCAATTPDFVFVRSDGGVAVDLKNNDNIPAVKAKTITANTTLEVCGLADGMVGGAIIILSV